ncbi:MAG TPA: hypothetical protein VFI31_15120 [Pirellulales bacterium]|nr:hypothetical protein [Pirellulales bacterium]
MTTGTSPKPPAAWRRWALAELDLQPGMSNDEARRILFTRLSDLDFMPPGGWDNALRVAGIAPCGAALDGPVFVPAQRAAEESLRAEVESFAARFFSLPPDSRAAQYQELVKQSAGMPAVAARLEGLWPALELPCEVPAVESPEAADLLDQARRLFLLPRQERASRRLTFLQQCRMNLPQWQRAATTAQTKFARYAALEPALFRELATSGNREKQREKIARQRRRSVRKTRTSQSVVRTTQKAPWWIWILVVVGLNGIRAAIGPSSNSHRTNSPVPQAPKIDLEKLNRDLEKLRQPQDDVLRRMQEQVEQQIQRGELPPDTDRRLFGQPTSAPAQPPTFPRTMPRGGPGRRFDQNRERMRDQMRRLDQQSFSPPSDSAPFTSSQRVEIPAAQNAEELCEIIRRVQEQQANRGSAQRASSPSIVRFELRVGNVEQAREMLRQLRERQAQSGPDGARDAAISALEAAIENASRSSP